VMMEIMSMETVVTVNALSKRAGHVLEARPLQRMCAQKFVVMGLTMDNINVMMEI
jgi:hypothetical protein